MKCSMRCGTRANSDSENYLEDEVLEMNLEDDLEDWDLEEKKFKGNGIDTSAFTAVT